MGYRKKTQKIFFSWLLVIVVFTGCQNTQFEVTDVEVQFISNMDNNPLFSWQISSETPDFAQSACRVLIADNPESINEDVGNVWDSGKDEEMGQLQYKYKESLLESGKSYFFKVKVWDSKGRHSHWSEVKRFWTPLDYPEDWKAKWITYSYHPDSALPIFKREIDIENIEQIESAHLYITAPGFYDAFINGDKIGNNVLDPGQTNYEDYTYYSVYEISTDLVKGKNVLGVMLGNGWYNQNVVWGKNMIYGHPVFIAQLKIQYKDGLTTTTGTDASWKWKHGPITFSNIYAGETYDANLEAPDFFKPGETDESWKNALLAENHPNELFQQFADPIQIMDSIETKGIITKGDGRYIFDFGQNFAGWVKLKIRGDKGQQITLKCVEELDENGEIDPRTTGIRATKVIQTLTYICKGKGEEIWEPKFTYLGFRYVEVDGLTAQPSNDLLKGMVVYSSLPKTGQFICSEENINRLHQLAEWTIKSNIHSIPTDCPHREKCGWTGDAHAVALPLISGFDARRFLSKYVFDMRSSGRRTNKELYFGRSFHDRSIINKPEGIPTMIVPGRRTSGVASPDWGTAMTQVPWYLYMYYGEKVLLQNFYPDMKGWVDYVHAINEDGIIPHGLGDWCPPGGNGNIDCPVSVSSTAYHILDLDIMSKTAKILGHNEDFDYYTKLHQKTIDRFNAQFYDSQHSTYGSQTANAMALDIGIVPADLREKVAASIVQSINEKFNGFISTGIFGISRIFKVLAENGQEEEVYRLLSKKGEYSFAYMWEHFDATTLWEVLPVYSQESEDLAFRSHSHPMQAGYDAWFYSGIAGINPSVDEPGFKKVVFKPYLTQYLTRAEASYESGFGTIKSAWKNEEGRFSWEIQIPENSTGEIYVPNYGAGVEVKVNGEPVEVVNSGSDFSLAGHYGSGTFLIEMNK